MLFKFICFIALLLSATFHVQADSREEVIELLNASSSMDVSDEANRGKTFLMAALRLPLRLLL
jgi:Mg2+/Co2+ transporter CorC